MSPTAKSPTSSADESLPSSSVRMPRAVRRIQNTIHVTKTTASTDIDPPKISWLRKSASKVVDVYVSSVPKPMLTTTAAPTPAATVGSRSRRSTFTR